MSSQVEFYCVVERYLPRGLSVCVSWISSNTLIKTLIKTYADSYISWLSSLRRKRGEGGGVGGSSGTMCIKHGMVW